MLDANYRYSFTLRELAKETGISRRTLCRYLKSGLLKGKSLDEMGPGRFSASDIERFEREERPKSGRPKGSGRK